MSEVYAHATPAGKIVTNFDDSATVDQTGTAKSVDVVVPAGKRWILKSLRVHTAGNQTVTITHIDAVPNNVCQLQSETLNNAEMDLPNHSADIAHANDINDKPLAAGHAIRFTFAGAVTCANEIAALVLEVPAE